MIRHARTATRLAALAFGATTVLATTATAREVHHVADVDGDLFVGVGVAENPEAAGHRALAVYLCDGAGAFRWMFGVASSDAVAFQAEDLRVSLDFTGEAPTGTIAAAGGEPVGFELAEAAAPDAGVFRPGPHARGGWIILNNGEQRGAIAFRERLTRPVLDPAEGVVPVDGGTIVAERDLGLEDCFPEPAGRCPVR
jgi:hypothetical protein